MKTALTEECFAPTSALLLKLSATSPEMLKKKLGYDFTYVSRSGKTGIRHRQRVKKLARQLVRRKLFELT